MSGIYTFEIGDFQCAVLIDGQFDRSGDTFFAHAPNQDAVRAALAERGGDYDAVPSWFKPLYINTGQYKVLVDTGNGPERGQLMQQLDELGVQPGEIDRVIITHAHGDHVGGNTTADGEPAFPNARYVIWQGEWDYWHSDDVMGGMGEAGQAFFNKNLTNLKDRFDFVDSETDIVPGIQAVSTPGHTPGHMALLFTSGEARLLHVADAIHQPLQIEFPDWSPRFDRQPDVSPITRHQLLRQAADEALLVFAFHFEPPGLGYVVADGDGWVWKPVQG